MNLFLFTISLVFYFALHSILAANNVKAFFYKNLLREKYYRLVFNLISVIGLVLISYSYFLFEKQWLMENNWGEMIGLMMMLNGGCWLYKSLKGYDLGEFSGLDQFSKTKNEKPIVLNTSGLNGRVRLSLIHI